MRSLIFLMLTASMLCCVLESKADFIREWLVLGSFAGPDQSTRLNTDYLGGEMDVKPYGGAKVGNRFWLRLASDREKIEFHKLSILGGPIEDAVVYAATYAFSPRTQPAQLYLGSDDGVVVWLNGDRVYYLDKMRGCNADEDTVDIDLQQGWNLLLFKVSNGPGGWALAARIANATGLRYQTDYPYQLPTAESMPKFEVFKSELGESILFDEYDNSFLGLDITIINSSPTTNQAGTFSVLSHQKKTIATQVLPELRGGEVETISTWIPIEEALTNIVKKRNLTLEFKSGEATSQTQLESKTAMQMLAVWFQPWTLKGWTKETVDGTERFRRTLIVPKMLSGYELSIMVDVGNNWASFKCNGKVLQPRFKGDSGDIEIAKQAQTGDSYEMVVQADSENRAETEIKESLLVLHHEVVEGYLGSVLYSKELLGLEFAHNSEIAKDVLKAVSAAKIDKTDKILQEINTEIQQVAPRFSEYTVSLLGNAHIDLAWLWRYPETIEVCKKTFTSALDNMNRYSDFKFAQGQAHAYYWMEQYEPELFERIRAKIKEGQWEVIGGTWAEPDKNMPSGESLVRQYLYGKKYFKEKFGVDVRVGFMPDTFGHAASLPQILKKCGIDYYIFYRPWEKERIVWWEWKDGSRVLAYRPPAWYNSILDGDVGKLPFETERNFGVKNTLRLYGVGDHGGGPTRRDIKLARKLDRTIGYPNVKFAYLHEYFPQLEKSTSKIPTYHGEINFIFRGCWTSQAMTKFYNRRLEALLPTTETFCFFARDLGFQYPQSQLEEAWRKLLFNQFHDIFDGSGIGEIYPDAKELYRESEDLATQALDGALQALASNIVTTGIKKEKMPIIVFNPLNWDCSEAVQIHLDCPMDKVPRFFDKDGSVLPSAKVGDGVWQFMATRVPGVGYKMYSVKLVKPKGKPGKSVSLKMRNKYFRVQIDQETGAVESIYDFRNNREVLRRPGNLLQLQTDNYGSMTAWRIGLKGPIVTLDAPDSIKVTENNDLRKVVEIHHKQGDSKFVQQVILYAGLPRIDFGLKVDWHHRDTMLKIAFPFNVDGTATFEIPFGTIERAQTGEEVVSQKWVDISNSEYGVSLLNDHKYGFDVKDSVVRMSALRSPHNPDPKADEGVHEMRYAIYPHVGDWKQANTVQTAYEFNTNMSAVITDHHQGTMPASGTLIGVDADNVVLTACKKSEYSEALIVRVMETEGRFTNAAITMQKQAIRVTETNMIEEETEPLKVSGSRFSISVRPFEVKTIKMEF